jgi:gliding motility-associated-like protein
LFAPSAFTPDGDGMNDDFAIVGYGSQDIELTIFNRWGEQVFQTKTLNNRWDGNYGGHQAKQEVYVYRLKYNAECEENEFTTAIGHVTVIR